MSGLPERRNDRKKKKKHNNNNNNNNNKKTPDDLIKNVATKVGVEVKEVLGTPKPGRSRPVIVKFTRYNKRSDFFFSNPGEN